LGAVAGREGTRRRAVAQFRRLGFHVELSRSA
jgi:hypothetical protein